jgi:exosortase
MRIAWFPILFLVCALPWPPLAYSKVATPLQNLAANCAVVTLNLTGVEAQQIGTKICIGGTPGVPLRTLNVAEACAGMRSLMTFISVGAALAFLSSRPLWQKLIIVFSAIPIAIFCNVIRVSGQGLLDHYVSHELSESFAHQFVGLIMLIPAFFLLLLVGWLLDKIFVEEAATKKRDAGVIIRRATPAGVQAPRRSLSSSVPGAVPSGENP